LHKHLYLLLLQILRKCIYKSLARQDVHSPSLLPDARVLLLFAELKHAHSSSKACNRKLLQLPGGQGLMQGLTGAMMSQAPQVRWGTSGQLQHCIVSMMELEHCIVSIMAESFWQSISQQLTAPMMLTCIPCGANQTERASAAVQIQTTWWPVVRYKPALQTPTSLSGSKQRPTAEL
jgi:hypothetical protein